MPEEPMKDRQAEASGDSGTPPRCSPEPRVFNCSMQEGAASDRRCLFSWSWDLMQISSDCVCNCSQSVLHPQRAPPWDPSRNVSCQFIVCLLKWIYKVIMKLPQIKPILCSLSF